jgi:hypothetical protein
LPYGWSVGRTRLIDFTGDGVPEIAYKLGTVGGTVSSPTLFGVSQWTGTSARRIFDFRNGRDPEPGYAYVVFVVTRIVTGTGGLPEIETRESLERISHHAPQMGRHTHRAGPRQRPYRRRVAAYDDASVGVAHATPHHRLVRAHTAHRSTGVPARPADYRLPARCCCSSGSPCWPVPERR